MNNPYYGVLIDSIANQYLIDHCGYTPASTKSPHAAIIANTYCDYFGSVAYPGKVEVGLRVAKLGKTSVVYEVGFFARGSDEIKAVGGSMHVWVERDGEGGLGRPLAEGMPEEVKRGYERLMEGGVESKL
jgi:acyl-CoA thioester hydrolase